MSRTLLILMTVLSASLLSGCARNPIVVAEVDPEPTQIPIVETPTQVHVDVVTEEPESEMTQSVNDYEICGTGSMIQVGFFKDYQGQISPTQLIRVRMTADEVRQYVSVVTCLVHDRGWSSNSDEVVNGYENEVVFFDKDGKGHTYRIIVGGHYVEPWVDGRPDIVSSLGGLASGLEKKSFTVEEWIQATSNRFYDTDVRQIGLDIYLDDTDTNRSDVFEQTHQFRDINHQIEQALLTGMGYPEDVPVDFFLFATESWLVSEE